MFFLLLSLGMLAGTIGLFFTKGLNYGIDFTGGIIAEISTEKPVELQNLRSKLSHSATLQKIDQGSSIIIRLPLEEGRSNDQIIAELKTTLSKAIDGKIEYRKLDSVGPQVGSELIEGAIIALFSAFAAIMFYVWLRFEWQYGVGAVLSLMHDALAVVFFYLVTQIEFDLTSVAAILTIIGYSINDTVVIYDRIRENIRKYKKMSLPDLIDLSVNETMSRTFLTAGTTLTAIVALVLFGGSILQSFSLGMCFGVLVGTYSSVYIATAALLYVDPRTSDNESAIKV